MPLDGSLYHVFLMIRLRLWVLWRKISVVQSHFHHIVSWAHCQTDSPLLMLTLITRLKLCLSGFSTINAVVPLLLSILYSFVYCSIYSEVFSFNEYISNYFDNQGEKIYFCLEKKWQSLIKLSSFLYILLWLNFHTIAHGSSRRPCRELSGHSLGSSWVWPWPWPWLITSWRVYPAM